MNENVEAFTEAIQKQVEYYRWQGMWTHRAIIQTVRDAIDVLDKQFPYEPKDVEVVDVLEVVKHQLIQEESE